MQRNIILHHAASLITLKILSKVERNKLSPFMPTVKNPVARHHTKLYLLFSLLQTSLEKEWYQ